MKTLKLFSAFALCSILFISCSQQNNSGAVYFLENNLSEKLIITTAQQNTTSSVITSKNVDLYLSSSNFFNSHIANLEALEITKAFYQVSDLSVDVSSSTIKLGNMVMPIFNSSSGALIEITDADVLVSIARTLQEEGKIRFSFEDTSSSNINLEIDITIELKGTFVN